MTKEKKVCPTCQGKKTIEGVYQCSSEWRGNPLPPELAARRKNPR